MEAAPGGVPAFKVQVGMQGPGNAGLPSSDARPPYIMHPPETTGGHVHAGTSKTLMVKDDEGGGGRSAWDKMRGESVSGEQHPSARPVRKSRKRDPNWQAPETTGGQVHDNAGQNVVVKDDEVSGGRSIWDKMRGESVSGQQCAPTRPIRKARMTRKFQALA